MKDYIELRKLTKENGGYIYDLAVESYDDIYNNTMSKGKTKLKSFFLGGNPITLEKKDFPRLVQKEYVVSTKADGVRFLLMIGNKSKLDDRHIYFIDRNKDFWIYIYNGEFLPTISNMPNCLIDGEFMMWGDVAQSKEHGIIRINQTTTTKPLVVYSIFDILYGPTNPTFYTQAGGKTIAVDKLSDLVDRSRLKMDMGASGAFMGPKGGYRWPWKKRYSVLETILLEPTSPLYNYNQLQNLFAFKMVLSPFVYLKDVLRKSQDPTKYMLELFVKELNYQFPEIPNSLKKMTDGLIFTPANKEYIQGAWDFCGNELFKWKPKDKLTVDLQLGSHVNIKNLPSGVLAYRGLSNKNKESVNVGYILSRDELKIGDIVECVWLSSKKNGMYFQVYKIRNDKTFPNSLNTIRSVINSIVNPFPMKLLHSMYTTPNIKNLDDSIYKVLDPSFKIRCGIKHIPHKLFTQEYLDGLGKLIDTYKKTTHAELETRIHLPSITGKSYYNCITSQLGTMDDITPTVKKFGPNGIRSNEAVLHKYLIIEDQIEKRQIGRIGIEPTDIMKLANYKIDSMNTVLSQELPNNNKFVPTMYRYQKRYELDPLPVGLLGRTPSVLWRIDITEYGDSPKSWGDAKRNYELKPRTSVEIEYAPGDQENNMWRYYEDNNNANTLSEIVNMFNLKPVSMNPKDVKTALNHRVSKLKDISIDFIINDYCKLIYWLLELIV